MDSFILLRVMIPGIVLISFTYDNKIPNFLMLDTMTDGGGDNEI